MTIRIRGTVCWDLLEILPGLSVDYSMAKAPYEPCVSVGIGWLLWGLWLEVTWAGSLD